MTIWSLVKTVAMEGGQLMVVDLSVQLSITITIYVAAHQSFEEAYKVAAAQAAYWNFGPQYLVGTMMIMKVIGAKMIAGGRTKEFGRFFAVATFFSGSVALGAIVAAALKGDYVALECVREENRRVWVYAREETRYPLCATYVLCGARVVRRMPNVWFAGGMLWVWRVMCAGLAMTCCLIVSFTDIECYFLTPLL